MKKFINDLKKALKTEKIPGLAAVYLYGSLVRGIVRKDSDIDIAILPAPNLNKEEVLILISHVEDIISRTLFKSGIKRDISIVNMADKFASILLLFSIISQGTLIYEAKKFETA